MLMEVRSCIHIIILTLQYFITDSKQSHVFNWWFLLAKMEPITKLLDKNLSRLRYEETVTRGCFWPLSCRSAILGYSWTHVTQAQFVVLSMAFFTFILYKSELSQIRTILVVIDVAIKLLLVLGILRNLWTVGLWAFFNFVLFRWTFAKFIILGIDSMFVKSFSMIAMKILVTFAIFATFADFSRPFFALFSKSRIWLCLLFLLFLPYVLLSPFR